MASRREMKRIMLLKVVRVMRAKKVAVSRTRLLNLGQRCVKKLPSSRK